MEESGQIPVDPALLADEIFCEALGIEDEEKRRAYVEQACAGNKQVKLEVTRLFDAQTGADTLFTTIQPSRISATEIANTFTDISAFYENLKVPLPDDDEVGKQIGNYKLLQKIGEGGVGNVYLAEQLKPVRRHVAFKIIKLGMDTRSVIARFEAERQALAMMEHPNIAHVLNAGETETGRPYFVMELVTGERITTYCDENKLAINQRLELFIEICHAIQHAHQKGIIHRDIKPSNVLVTRHNDEASPMVIDFGIAKATTGDLLTDKTIQTSVAPFIGTPAYMSPEQANWTGMDIDTRSDIYSLGILLHELLVGKAPFDQKELLKQGLDEMCRTIRESDPPLPSVQFRKLPPEIQKDIAEKRQTDPHRMAQTLSGDLDAIIAKTLEKDRTRRYETANALAVDIGHFMHDEPVTACPPSRSYRFRKLVRRNRGVFASVSAISLTLIAGLTASSWLYTRERQAHLRAYTAELSAREAEQQQIKLRKEAEDREHITQAAFLISQGRIEEADRIVETITSELTPSLEAESVLRTLGEWHALRGQWDPAAERFNLLLKVDIKDDSWAITEDLLMAGPILIERGKLEDYESFRMAAIDRNEGTDDPVFAERTLKISLLIPADAEIMKQLEPFVEVASSANQGRIQPFDYMAAWRCVSLALMAYRQDFTPTARAWAEESLSYSIRNPAREATAHIIKAMACYKLNDMNAARHALSQGRLIIMNEFAKGVEKGDGSAGFWFDWLFARILLREAETLMQ